MPLRAAHLALQKRHGRRGDHAENESEGGFMAHHALLVKEPEPGVPVEHSPTFLCVEGTEKSEKGKPGVNS